MTQHEPPASSSRHVLVPIAVVVCFALVYVGHVPMLLTVPVLLLAAGLYVAAPRVGRSSLARFDREVVAMLATGHRKGLVERYQRAAGMRLFAPPALVAERRGLVFAETGDPGAARRAYHSALEGYEEDDAPLGVTLGLAHASFALGDDREAIRLYRLVLRQSGSYPRIAQNLAHALANRGEDLHEAEELAEKALASSGDEPAPALQLVRALVHAKLGEAKEARKLLKRTRKAKGVDNLREDVEVALA